MESLLAPLSLGIAAGLFFGKQIGIMISVFIASRTGLAQLPAGASWREIYGVALLCGIGFTMSLFIGLLAFADAEHESMIKLGGAHRLAAVGVCRRRDLLQGKRPTAS